MSSELIQRGAIITDADDSHHIMLLILIVSLIPIEISLTSMDWPGLQERVEKFP